MKELNLEKKHASLVGILVLLVTSGCTTPAQYISSGEVFGVGYSVINAQPVVGVGYGVINAQSGNSPEEKRLMAIKVSKLEAYKSLAEQLYGQYLDSRSTLSNLKLGQEELVSRVEGLIVGAKVVSIKPISADTYQTVLEIDQPATLSRLEGALTGDLSSVEPDYFMPGQRRKRTVD